MANKNMLHASFLIFPIKTPILAPKKKSSINSLLET